MLAAGGAPGAFPESPSFGGNLTDVAEPFAVVWLQALRQSLRHTTPGLKTDISRSGVNKGQETKDPGSVPRECSLPLHHCDYGRDTKTPGLPIPLFDLPQPIYTQLFRRSLSISPLPHNWLATY